MVLARMVKGVIFGRGRHGTSNAAAMAAALPASTGPRVLNVGGASKSIAIPGHYRQWEHLLLDIAPNEGVDIVQDARELCALPAAQFDAVYCSHNLEHYFRHDTIKVLAGFVHVLKDSGFAEIRVPDIKSVARRIVAADMDIHDELYHSAGGPITAHDVLYGWGREIESSGQDFYAHKCGFTATSLGDALKAAGFTHIAITEREAAYELHALAFVREPSADQRDLLRL